MCIFTFFKEPAIKMTFKKFNIAPRKKFFSGAWKSSKQGIPRDVKGEQKISS
jgi:hypothetical protein